MKAKEREGENKKRVELGKEEDAEGFDGDTGTSDEHEGEIVTKGNQIFIQNILHLFSYRFRYIKLEKSDYGRRRSIPTFAYERLRRSNGSLRGS